MDPFGLRTRSAYPNRSRGPLRKRSFADAVGLWGVFAGGLCNATRVRAYVTPAPVCVMRGRPPGALSAPVAARGEKEPCAHCGAERPPCARWPGGPVCDPCYRAALGRRGTCAGCARSAAWSRLRGLVPTCAATAPGCRRWRAAKAAGPRNASTGTASAPAGALAERARQLLTGPAGSMSERLVPVYE